MRLWREVVMNEEATAEEMSNTLTPIDLAQSTPLRQDCFTVLGMRVDAVQIPDVISRMIRWITHREMGNYIAVTGMHGIMEARQNPCFKDILNQASLLVADGMPLVWIGNRHQRGGNILASLSPIAIE